MDNQNNNNNIIRSKVSSNEYESLDDDLINNETQNNFQKNYEIEQQQPVYQQAPQPRQQIQQPINQNQYNESSIQNQQANANNNDNSQKSAVFAGLSDNTQNNGLRSNMFGKKNNNEDYNIETIEPWMTNQPLSAQSLGVSQNEIKKNVEAHDDNSKYFNASSDADRVTEDNELKPENFAKPLFAKKVNPEKESEKKKNGTLLRYYLGNTYNTVSMGVFSLSALFFGGLYLISNRLILIGLGIFAMQMYILCFVSWKKAIIIYGILSLVLAFVSNPLIMFMSKNKIKMFRATHPKYVEEQLEVYVKRKNKSYGNLAILIFLISLGVTSYMFVVNHYKFSGPIGYGYRLIDRLYGNYTKSEVVKIEYDDSININDFFSFTINEGFKKEEKEYKYMTEEKGEYNYCSFSIRKVSNYNDANSLLQSIKSINKTNGKIETEEINDLIYSKYNFNNDYGKNYYLSIKNKDNVFLIKYFSGKDTPQNICDNMFEDFKDTLIKVEEIEKNEK